MRAIVYTQYGTADNLQMREVPPPEPGRGQVLIKVAAVALNAADRLALHATPFFLRFMFGLFRPTRQILGADVAGTVVAVGPAVTQFKVGDAVFGDLSGAGLGGLAEYVCAPEAVLAHKPAELSFVEAAAVPLAGGTALQAVRAGGLRAGQHVLVVGAGGGVGSFAIQIAKHLGAAVTAACSPGKHDWARALGADHVCDYRRDTLSAQTGRYDLILIINGDWPLSALEPALTPTGTLVVVGGSVTRLFQSMAVAPFKSRPGGRTFRVLNGQPNQADLNTLATWLAAGQLKPVIETTYPLSQSPAAMREFEKGHARGKIVMTVP
jgi:NADPH:quinone reductase-like Zn-dependent oxidoreductase